MSAVVKRKLASTAFIIGVFVFWELACLIGGISDLVLPRPTQIVAALIEYAPGIWPHAYQTLYVTLFGFSMGVCIGLSLGVLIGSSKLAYDTAYPLLVGISSIPKVAVVPIFVLWFGAGTVPAILTAMIICIFPIVVNVSTGIATVEPELEERVRARECRIKPDGARFGLAKLGPIGLHEERSGERVDA